MLVKSCCVVPTLYIDVDVVLKKLKLFAEFCVCVKIKFFYFNSRYNKPSPILITFLLALLSLSTLLSAAALHVLLAREQNMAHCWNWNQKNSSDPGACSHLLFIVCCCTLFKIGWKITHL